MNRILANAVVLPFAVLVLASAGCNGSNAQYKPNTTAEGIDLYYNYYDRPLQVGRSYDYRTVEQNTFTEQGGDYDPAISPDGKWLLFSSTYHSQVPEIYLKPVNGSTITRLTNSTYAEIQPCFSPDGKSFAYATNRRGNWDICLEQIEGGKNPRWLTLDMPKTDEISPSFHPGGKWLAFSTFNQRVGQWEIAVKNIETGQVRYLGEGLYPRFSPRGDRIAFQRARSREPRWYSIWVIEVDEDLNTRNPTEVVSSAKWAAINPAWSPDGKYLAFATVHESPLAQSTTRILMGDDIWVVNIEGQDLVKITDTEAPESHPVWGRDDKGRDRIFFCSMMKGPKNIWSLQPIMPEPFGSVSGPLPGPKPRNAPPEKAPPANSGAGPESALRGYLAPPPPAMTAPGTGSN